MADPYLSIIIPVKNEEDNIRPLLESIYKGLAPLKRSYEIVVVDDGSDDDSLGILKSCLKDHRQLKIVQLDKNHGQTAAFTAGFKHARGRVIATMDGDGQNDPGDIPRMISKLEKGNWHMVAGYRTKRHDNFIRRFSSRIANEIRRRVVRDPLRDTGCSLKVFYRECVLKVAFFEGMHRFMGALFTMYGFEVSELPVRHHSRMRGQTKYGIGNRVWKATKDLLAVRWMQRRCLKFNVSNIYQNEGDGDNG